MVNMVLQIIRQQIICFIIIFFLDLFAIFSSVAGTEQIKENNLVRIILPQGQACHCPKGPHRHGLT